MSSKKLIKLSLFNGRAATFNSDDYFKIRSEYHITGKLVGVPVNSKGENGLPAFYSVYETKLLIDEQLVIVEHKTGLKGPPSDEIKAYFANHQQQIVADLQKPYIESKLLSTRTNMEHIIRGKKKKLMKSGILEEDINISPDDILMQETTRIKQSLISQTVFMQIPTMHPFEIASEAVQSFSVSNFSKYKVFRSLWKQGFYITNGDSFGCDFLVYPGDPIHFHASKTVHVIDRDQLVDVKFIVSCGRLAVSVNKKCVFAYANSDDTVTYQNIEWSNPKLKQLYMTDSEKNQNLGTS